MGRMVDPPALHPDDLDGRLRARDAALAALADRLAATEEARCALERRADRQTAEIAALSARLLDDAPDRAELQARAEILQGRVHALEAELTRLRAEPLWRLARALRRIVTAPFRARGGAD